MTPFKLTSETIINSEGIKLFRIQLTKDCKFGKKGDKGGWIESLKLKNKVNRIGGNAWIQGNAQVYGNARVYGDALVYGNAQVSGKAMVYGNARVYGEAQVFGNARVYGDAKVSGNARVNGDAWDKSPLQVQGTKHFISQSSDTTLTIGCYTLSISEWKKNFRKIGIENGYDKKEIKEYGLYIDLAIKLSKLK